MKENVTVFIGDIVKSRKIEDRAKFQKLLKRSLEEVNEDYQEKILADLMMTGGDEFEGVLKRPDESFELFRRLEEKLRPVEFRAGIGVGKIETEATDSAAEMDGPAFHNARKASRRAKTMNSSLQVETGIGKIDDPLNRILSLLSIVERGWTDKQREVVEHCSSHPELKQEEVAEHFGVSQPAISRTLKNANWRAVEDARSFLRCRFKSLEKDVENHQARGD